MLKKQTGFTIVELLIVIVVIGILAAITIVAFNGVQNRAHNSAVQNDLAQAAKRFEFFKIDNGRYPSNAELTSVGISATKGSYLTGRDNFYYCRSVDEQSYALGAVSKADNDFMLTNGTVASHANVWGSTTCTAAGNTGGTSNSGYYNGTGLWSAWVN